jgi:nitrate reductase NapD
MNISSIIIQTLPEHIESVIKAVNESDFCDYEVHNDIGKIVVTLEGKDAGEEIEKLIKIQQIPHVIAIQILKPKTLSMVEI